MSEDLIKQLKVEDIFDKMNEEMSVEWSEAWNILD